MLPQRVLAAIELDDQFRFCAAEVRDEGANWVLAPEPRTA
jgi:hypothetical protein